MTTQNIEISIPLELTAAMVIRAGIIKNEARALELATELHEIVARCVELFRVDKRRLVELPDDDDPDGEPVELESLREPNALEVADFTLAVWRQALTSNCDDDSSDAHEAEWISDRLAGLNGDGADDLYFRWLMIGDIVTGSDVADWDVSRAGGVQ
jgi:hypothetical protein